MNSSPVQAAKCISVRLREGNGTENQEAIVSSGYTKTPHKCLHLSYRFSCNRRRSPRHAGINTITLVYG